MNPESGTTRWWEYYLPRYLMPSVAGVAIVNWLTAYGGDGLRSLLLLPSSDKPLDSSSLVLLFLYGNLFCYIASYPVLVFHATRVMDFQKGRWRAHVLDGYLIAVILLAIIAVVHLVPPGCRYWVAFPTAIIIASFQLMRLRAVLSHRFKVKGHGDLVSDAYYYSYVLAHRRGIPVVEETEHSQPKNTTAPAGNLSTEDEEDKEETTSTLKSTNSWRREFMDTYRHFREHGNSAFIFLLELVLAALVYCVVTKPAPSPKYELGAIGLLLGIWTTPSIFVHLLAQHLERRFSRYEQKLKSQVIHS